MVGRLRELAGHAFADDIGPAELESGTVESGRSRRILLVDDNQTNQTVARLILEKMGHRVDLCSDGYEGVRAATTLPYDIVFMDVHMPGMDGIAATKRIRAAPGDERQVPIFALTANVLPETEQACLDAGMIGFLQKPVNEKRLGEVLVNLTADPVENPSSENEATPNFVALPLIEGRKLDELRSSLGADKLDLILGVFTNELKELGAKFDASHDLEEQGQIAHTIKGASSNFGAARVQHAARLFEAAAQAGDEQRAQALRDGLSAAIQETMEIQDKV